MGLGTSWQENISYEKMPAAKVLVTCEASVAIPGSLIRTNFKYFIAIGNRKKVYVSVREISINKP